MAELPKNYEPESIEPRWYEEWTARGYFHADATAPKAPFAIVIPPPNVTGSLHMGHALGDTIEDIFTRWKRMAAYNAMWLPGTDHAGIATQLVVERELREKEGKSRHDLGREEFVKRIWAWRERTGDRILEQLKKLGCSLDWSRTKFTMDPQYSAAVIEAFVRLHEEGLIYRARRLINWCVSCRTALSDLEVEFDEQTQGELYEFAYPLADGSGEVVVATTRPETMLGDTAVAVHPDDPRHASKIGKEIKNPITGQTFKVIADAILVDPKFGTGAVKVTPAHDPNDFETGQRHNLPMISIFDEAGKVTAAGGPFAGLDRFAARKAVKARLKELGLERGSKPHMHAVGHCQRCETVVEPTLSTQWFVKMEPLAKPAIEAVEQGKTKFVPETWSKTFFHWMNNIRDWCISRQLWWGHRIPVWYCGDPACQQMTVARTTPAACGHCGGADLKQDEDVLDTWFSSWLWPFATLGWPNETRELKTFYPTTMLDTGYDILFFWVARMMMAGLHFMKKVPFRTVYLHTMVTDEKGEKMSKVKGNTIDPLDVIAKHGADALRFALAWLTTQASQGKNIKFSMGNVEDARRFANKIWNATRFALINLEGFDADRFADQIADGPDRAEFDLPERWILSRVQRAAEEVDTALEEYRIADAAQAAYHFVWNELCDWYIELAKAALARGDAASKWKIQGALVTALETAMRLLHPFMPFLTEEIWQQLPKPSGAPQSIMITLYPVRDVRFHDDASEASMALVQKVIVALRGIRAEKNIPSITRIRTLLVVTDDYKKTILDGYKTIIAEQGRCSDVRVRRTGSSFGGDFILDQLATALAGDVEVMVPLDGLVDAGAEKAKLEKDRAKLVSDRDYLAKKLTNPKFVDRAPAEVLDKDRAKLAELETALTRMEEALARLNKKAS
ncbi:MAG TPA: valine--tRNA ligase [Polyangia bacterium]|nr:valine--tRNA ligase [Polyangia bacterium]